MQPQFKEVPREWDSCFVKLNFFYIKNLVMMNLWENNQSFSCVLPTSLVGLLCQETHRKFVLLLKYKMVLTFEPVDDA